MSILWASDIRDSSKLTRWLTESDWLSQGQAAPEATRDAPAAPAADAGLAAPARVRTGAMARNPATAAILGTFRNPSQAPLGGSVAPSRSLVPDEPEGP